MLKTWRAWLMGAVVALSVVVLVCFAFKWSGRAERRNGAVTTAYQQALEDSGPPPTERSIPVARHRTRSGVDVKAHWRTPPDSSKANNLRSKP